MASKPAVNSKDSASVLAAASFVVVFVVIGLPLWWNTTAVFRVPLPYEELEDLSNLQVSHVIPVTVVLSNRNVQQSKLFEELYLLSNGEAAVMNAVESTRPRIKYAWKMRTTLEEEEAVIQRNESPEKMDELLHKVSSIDEAGVYEIIVLDDSKFISPTNKLVGCHRRGYIAANAGPSVVRDIISVVRTMVQENLLKKIYVPPTYERRKPEKERMRSLSTTTDFHITFSLLVPEPQILDVQWDIEQAVEAYIMPFIRKLSPVADVDIKSQILYMTTLPIETLKGENGEKYINFEQLPTLMNTVERRLSAYGSVNPNLNFITYIPPRSQSPLYIVDKRGDIVPTNAFMLPQWGGFIIKNIETRSSGKANPQIVELDVREVMEIFLGQLRLLLGLPDVNNKKDASVTVMHSSEGCEWELDFLLRKNTQEQLSFAASSLHSLGQLLQKISNIVIKDDVGAKVYSSVSYIKRSISSLQQGFLEDGFVTSKNAFNDSETAFYDPSLLSLLYFPEDQKYAVYVPLFLPVSIPVLISLRHLWMYWQQRNKKEKKE